MNMFDSSFFSQQPDARVVQEQLDQVKADVLGLSQSFKIVATSTVAIEWDGTTITGSSPLTARFQHNLGYQPVVFAFLEDGVRRRPIPAHLFIKTVFPAQLAREIDWDVDETTLTFNLNTWLTSSPQTFNIRFFLGREPASA